MPAGEFDIKAFEAWFKRYKLYNVVNPNLRSPHSGGFAKYSWGRFRDNIINPGGATPGISYTVPYGEVMVAAAPGVVYEVKELHTGRAGGMVVMVGHPDDGKGVGGPSFSTFYAHLDTIFVKDRQYVERGQPIGNVTEHNKYAKLIAAEEGNLVDPDYYGKSHTFMKYLADHTDEFDEGMDGKIIDLRITNQRNIIWDLNHFSGGLLNNDKVHTKRKNNRCIWTSIEKFRFFEELYKIKPDLFPNLSSARFEEVKMEFYKNQPILLTLPLRKSGYKR